MAKLYATARLFVNFFQPSFKLAERTRDGAKVHKRYHPAATPFQRLLADSRASEETKDRVRVVYVTLDPGSRLREMRPAQQRLVEITDAPVPVGAEKPTAPGVDEFLAGLRIAWQRGEVRPTARPKPKAKRLRRRADPFAAVADQLRAWVEAEPQRTSRELFGRLQAEHPGVYADGQLRTCQRRVKIWRREMAHRLVFGSGRDGEPILEGEAP